MASKKQYLDINKSVSNNCLNIKKVGKKIYKKLRPIFDKKIGQNSKLGTILNEIIGKDLFKELRPISAKKNRRKLK